MSGVERCPVDVLTGFLGAGKTSLLRRLIAGGTLRDTAVLVNEFAALPVDDRLVSMAGKPVGLIGEGCICCVTDGNLRAALIGLLDARERGTMPAFSRVLIETSGLADPGAILAALAADPMLKARLSAGRVVTLVRPRAWRGDHRRQRRGDRPDRRRRRRRLHQACERRSRRRGASFFADRIAQSARGDRAGDGRRSLRLAADGRGRRGAPPGASPLRGAAGRDAAWPDRGRAADGRGAGRVVPLRRLAFAAAAPAWRRYPAHEGRGRDPGATASPAP